MRRLVGPVLGLLLGGVMATTATAQRSGRAPIVLEEPRPSPVFPVALVPFSLASELCKNGHLPVVSLKVHNVLTQPVATLRLRGRDGAVLDNATLHCGGHVAIWDGTIDGGTRVASPNVYWLQLVVDGKPTLHKVIVTEP